MLNLDYQLEYWNSEGARKSFAHPLNLRRIRQWLTEDSLIIDFGCGYGRCLGELFEAEYTELVGFDFSTAMIDAARKQFPQIVFEQLDSTVIPLPDGSVDAALLFSVLTCVPGDEG